MKKLVKKRILIKILHLKIHTIQSFLLLLFLTSDLPLICLCVWFRFKKKIKKSTEMSPALKEISQKLNRTYTGLRYLFSSLSLADNNCPIPLTTADRLLASLTWQKLVFWLEIRLLKTWGWAEQKITIEKVDNWVNSNWSCWLGFHSILSIRPGLLLFLAVLRPHKPYRSWTGSYHSLFTHILFTIKKCFSLKNIPCKFHFWIQSF